MREKTSPPPLLVVPLGKVDVRKSTYAAASLLVGRVLPSLLVCFYLFTSLFSPPFLFHGFFSKMAYIRVRASICRSRVLTCACPCSVCAMLASPR
ncbi:hypothetical protein LX36DRAFT_465604 [Colletotrichum falcatum]|nr:hypothetical protein LX36DRAFT_465604 [Colletotrichum falcatum]